MNSRGEQVDPALHPPIPRPHFVLFRQMFAFGVVGVFGFLVDAGVLYLARWMGLGLIVGRVLSYVMAATSTWTLNRRFTFPTTHGHGIVQEWALFMVSQLAGALFNLGLYAWLISNSSVVVARPVVGVAAGSLAGMLVNFLVAKKFVFKER